jgi:CHAT domain-containing protein
LEWRAYAGLGRRDEALSTLESVTILRAGAGPNEISANLAPLVRNLVGEEEIEAAFNLAEQIAELERFHRLAPLLGEITATDQNLYRELYPRLERIGRLQQQIEEAQGKKRQHLRESLTRELALVDAKTGPSNEKLPLLVRRITVRNQRRQVMIILGLAADAERAANAAVQNPAGPDLQTDTYQSLLDRHDALREELRFSQMADQSAGGIAFFSPAPVEAIDVMETLPADARLIRLFRVGDELIQFTLTPDDITATVLKMKASDKFVLSAKGTVYIACEDPALLPADGQAALALSATHWLRSIGNRKPFKQSLLAIPPLTEEIQGVETKHPAGMSVEGIARTLPDIHTLLISSPIEPAASVPAHAGERPSVFLAVDRHPARRLRFANLLTHSDNLSLLMLPGASGNDAYTIGHLASLYGIPAVLLPEVRNEDAAFIGAFFEAYPSESTLAAVRRAQAVQTPHSSWLLLGDRGMTPAESSAFLEAHFVQYVKDGQAAFKNSAWERALILFENAVQIASSVENYRQYLAALYQYSRDSAYQNGDMTKALKYARAVVDIIAEETPDSQAHAEALLRLGLVYARLEQYEDAVPNLAEAVEIMAALELGPEQVTALAELGVVLENATAYDRALSRFQSAASLSAALNQDKLVADQYARIGRIYDLRLSQYAVAIQNYQKALDIHQDADIQDKVAQSRLNIGRCYRLLGNFAAAAKHYQEALALVVPEDFELRAKIVLEQANNAWFQARYQDAFKLQRSVNRVAVEQNLPLMQIMSLNTAGLIWWTLGDFEKALQDLDLALLKARKFEHRKDEIATTLNNMGIVYRDMGRYEDALQAFDAALAIDTELKSRWAIAYDLRNKALTLLRMDRTGEAVGLFGKAAAEAHAIGNRINESKALLGLGNAHQILNNRADAETAFWQALDMARSMGLREIEWRALYGLAGLQLSTNPDDARELLVSAVNVIEEMRTQIKIEQLRDHFIANKLEVYEMLVALLADQGEAVAAFEMAERSRARNFIDILGNQQLNLSREIDQQLYNHHQELKARIAEHEMLLSQSTEDAERKVYRQARDDLRHQLENLMLEIQAQNPQLSALITVQPLNADQLLDLLEPGVALLSYYVLKREVFCWVVGRQSGIQLVRTPLVKDTLGQAILDYRRMIQNLEPVEDKSLTLFNWLVAPVQAELDGVTTLGIIPHGPLHYLSFATLSNRDAHLVDRYALFYLPSASVLDFTFKRRIKQKQLTVLAIGNPDLKDPAFDLPFAEHEVGSIKWNFPNITVLTGKKATENWIVNNIDKFGIIHLASHGEFDPINPLFSALKFTPSPGADGNLQAAEVFGLRITSDMVVLSACQTGLGKVTAGDDIVGLNRAFLYAGTHTIISSLWRVSDLTTAIMIKQFYRQYAADHQKAASLRRAILHVKNRYPHPGYWGAFTLVGDYY